MKHPHEIEKQIVELLDSYCQQDVDVKPLSNTFFDRIERLKAKAEESKQDEYEHLRQAIRDGKRIEYFNGNEWVLTSSYGEFISTKEYYRIHQSIAFYPLHIPLMSNN